MHHFHRFTSEQSKLTKSKVAEKAVSVADVADWMSADDVPTILKTGGRMLQLGTFFETQLQLRQTCKKKSWTQNAANILPIYLSLFVCRLAIVQYPYSDFFMLDIL